jgi:hypothetical protein
MNRRKKKLVIWIWKSKEKKNYIKKNKKNVHYSAENESVINLYKYRQLLKNEVIRKVSVGIVGSSKKIIIIILNIK